ncbi:MAG: cytochrome c biogenesis protein CcdA, partial [Meiothermus sp.]|nr:cytochrome c biogenesis protein CcdA [Meiothermus sp.]
MSRLKTLFVWWIISLSLISAVNSAAAQTTCLYYFWGEGCPHCAKVAGFLPSIEQRYPWLRLERFEIYRNRENLLRLNALFDQYQVPQNEQGIPAVFIGGRYLVGDTPILKYLESLVLSHRGATCPTLAGTGVTSPTATPTSSPSLGLPFLLTLLGAALVDSINPCAIAVILLLFGGLMIFEDAEDRRRVLRTGLAFTLGIFLAYVLFGLGILSALRFTSAAGWFKTAVGALAILIGLANLKDYFWYGGGGFVTEIPRRWRPALFSLIRRATDPPVAFVTGAAVTLFELPCTGGPYLFVLGLMAQRSSQLEALPYL